MNQVQKTALFCVITATSSGNFLSTFRDKFSVHLQRPRIQEKGILWIPERWRSDGQVVP